jgi:hypothetical protein
MANRGGSAARGPCAGRAYLQQWLQFER